MGTSFNNFQRKRNAMTLTKALGIMGYDAWSQIDRGKHPVHDIKLCQNLVKQRIFFHVKKLYQ